MCAHPYDDRRHIRKLSAVEWLVVITTAIIVLGLIFSPVHWASSGTIRIPVRVLVFDPTSGKGIAKAQVSLYRAYSLTDSSSAEDRGGQYDPRPFDQNPDVASGLTDAEGIFVVDFEFQTGANHQRPAAHAKVSRVWVHARAEGYGGVVVPVRPESQPVTGLKEQGQIFVPIGLMKIQSP
jgi:hypothetical protein